MSLICVSRILTLSNLAGYRNSRLCKVVDVFTVKYVAAILVESLYHSKQYPLTQYEQFNPMAPIGFFMRSPIVILTNRNDTSPLQD